MAVPKPIPNIANVNYAYGNTPGNPVVNTGAGSNTVVTTVNHAGITSSKAVDNTVVGIGDTITYTLTFTNTGNILASDVVITDTIPNGTAYIPGSLSINVPYTGDITSTINLTNGLAPGESAVVTYSVIVDTIPNPNPIPNASNVTYKYTPYPGLPSVTRSNNSNTVNTQVNYVDVRPPSNTVKVADKSYADVGEVITYTITVTNTGNIPATNVVLIDTVPNGTTYIPGSATVDGVPASGTPNSGLQLGTIPPGGTAIIQFQVIVGNTIPTPNPLVNQAQVIYHYQSNPLNPVDQVGTAISEPVETLIQTAVLGATKAANKDVSAPGDTITYTVTVTNTGNIEANDVTVQDVIPVGTTFIPGTVTVDGVAMPTQDPTTGINAGTVPAGATKTISFDVRVNEDAPGVLMNTATITDTYKPNPFLPPVSGNPVVTNQVNVNVLFPELKLTKSSNVQGAQVGDTITYTITVQNVGELPAENIIIQDPLTSNITFVGNVTLNGVPISGNIQAGINIGSLGVGQTAVLTFDAKVITVPNNTDTTVENTANAHYGYQVNPNNPLIPGTSESNVNKVKIYSPELTVTKSAEPTNVLVGVPFVYTITVENTGDFTINDVTFVDQLPGGFNVLNVEVDGTTVPANSLITGIPLGTMAVGEKHVITVTVVIDDTETLQTFNNVALATGTAKVDPNLPAAIVQGVGVDYVGINIFNPSITIAKTADKTCAIVGETVAYSLTVTNIGNMPLDNVILYDPLTPQLEFIKGSLTVAGVNVPSASILAGISLGTLKPKQSIVITFEVKVISACVCTVINIAHVQYTINIPGDTPIIRDEASNPYELCVEKAELQIIKKANKEEVCTGECLGYTVEIINRGTLTAYNVNFKDHLPDAVELIQGSFCINGKVLRRTNFEEGIFIGDIEPGQEVYLRYNVYVLEDTRNMLIMNEAHVSFNYYLPNGVCGKKDGTGGSKHSNMTTTKIIVRTSEAIRIDEDCHLPYALPDMKCIDKINGNIEITGYKVLEYASCTRDEHTHGGYELRVWGELNIAIEYTACNRMQSIHQAYFSIPIRIVIDLPSEYYVDSKLEVKGIVEKIDYHEINKRSFYMDAKGIINVSVLNC